MNTEYYHKISKEEFEKYNLKYETNSNRLVYSFYKHNYDDFFIVVEKGTYKEGPFADYTYIFLDYPNIKTRNYVEFMGYEHYADLHIVDSVPPPHKEIEYFFQNKLRVLSEYIKQTKWFSDEHHKRLFDNLKANIKITLKQSFNFQQFQDLVKQLEDIEVSKEFYENTPDKNDIMYYSEYSGEEEHRYYIKPVFRGDDKFYIHPKQAQLGLLLLDLQLASSQNQYSEIYKKFKKYDILHLWEQPENIQLLLFLFGDASVVEKLKWCRSRSCKFESEEQKTKLEKDYIHYLKFTMKHIIEEIN